jgi:hypothetical protein
MAEFVYFDCKLQFTAYFRSHLMLDNYNVSCYRIQFPVTGFTSADLLLFIHIFNSRKGLLNYIRIYRFFVLPCPLQCSIHFILTTIVQNTKKRTKYSPLPYNNLTLGTAFRFSIYVRSKEIDCV